jgi:hypothetical protein
VGPPGLPPRASQLSKDQKLEFDIGSYVRSGFRVPQASRAARILLDKDKKPPPPE